MMHLEYFTEFLKHLGHELSDWRIVTQARKQGIRRPADIEWHVYCTRPNCGKMFIIYESEGSWKIARYKILTEVRAPYNESIDMITSLNHRDLRSWNGEPLNYYREKATLYKHHLCSKVNAFR